MAERGHHVSPQHCEGKINDLSKRYYNDLLGRGTSCDVVENPGILDVTDFPSKKEKDEVRKMLRSKHLYYEEMCLYIDGNRLHLPHDLALQRSLQLALKNRDDHGDNGSGQDGVADDHDNFEMNYAPSGDSKGKYAVLGGSMKKLKQGHGQEDVSFGNSLSSQFDMNEDFRENMKATQLQKQWTGIRTRSYRFRLKCRSWRTREKSCRGLMRSRTER